ncbi:MAG: MOSC domain-containing protein [Bryobacterales bacterium]|nr:MOSC domain-containing protein [Bryobacterales bacterium]
MTGKVVQVSTSPGGMPNLPVLEGDLKVEGFAGDGWNNPKSHGGPQQAVLLVALEVIRELQAKGFPVYPGAIGENVTTEGIHVAGLRAGQRFQLGDAVIELTKIRTPCYKLDVYGNGIQQEIYDAEVKQGNASSPRWAKSGFYAKVLQPGVVRAKDQIVLLEMPAAQSGVGETA